MKKLTITLGIIIGVLTASYVYFWPKARFNLAVEATGGFSYQIALNGLTQIPCYTSCPAPVTPTCCMGGMLCPTKTVAQCLMYTEVTGAPSGGDGNMALFLKSALASAGVGSELVAGGLTPTEMDSGVLAGAGGCYGSACSAINNKNLLQRFVEIGKYIIASLKE